MACMRSAKQTVVSEPSVSYATPSLSARQLSRRSVWRTQHSLTDATASGPRRQALRASTIVASAVHDVEAPAKPSAFEELSASLERAYVMVSGKGGVGKTSVSASLALRFAAEGHTVLVVSTDPAHSLSDSLGQDVSGGQPVLIEGTDLPIWGMEIDPEAEKDVFRSYVARDGGKEVKDFMSGMAMGAVTSMLGDLKLGEF